MEQPQKLLGKVVALDSLNRRVTIEIDFFDPEKQEIKNRGLYGYKG